MIGDCKVLLYSSRPSSAHVSFAGGFGLGVADVHGVVGIGVELEVVLVWQLRGNVVVVVVVVVVIV